MKNRYYYESISMGEFATEGGGHTQKETAEEFKVSVKTVRKRINCLATINPKLYQKVMKKWHERDGYESVII